ncbi:hypothetical protein CDAR_622781 [Caerostris darwini]|uniref:Uncharacterized protein n=1 Tax=Caerostris darwini TaxID=1538125 RepID=A0AAV4TBQ8_9ARAC|nr:hypothetical protein CDAR_622781 [Caerostris darwini]
MEHSEHTRKSPRLVFFSPTVTKVPQVVKKSPLIGKKFLDVAKTTFQRTVLPSLSPKCIQFRHHSYALRLRLYDFFFLKKFWIEIVLGKNRSKFESARLKKFKSYKMVERYLDWIVYL